MIALSRDQTRRLLAVHGWSGALLGLLLYVVLLSGTIAVFAHEIGTWSISGSKAADPLDGPIDSSLRQIAREIDPAYRKGLDVYYNSAGHIVAFFHGHAVNESGLPDDKGVMLGLDPLTRAVVSRAEGYGSDLYGADPAGALDQFLVDLHVRLHLEDPWGLYLTGILGLLLLVAMFSGLLLHRHLLTDLFIAPRRSSRLLKARDRHTLAGSWSLLFAFVLAFTGSFLSFAIPLGVPLVSATAFGGDRFALLERLYGLPVEEDATPARTADLDRIKARSAEIAGSSPEGLAVVHWGRADAQVHVYHPPAEGALRGVKHSFDGVTGRFLGRQPDLGTAPSLGDSLFGLMFALHFGSFAGLLSKVIWGAVGSAICYVCLSGLSLWLRRREDTPGWHLLSRTVPVVGYGLPIAMAGAGQAYFLSLASGQTLTWTPVGFLVASALAIVLGLAVQSTMTLRRTYQIALGLSLTSLPLLRWLTGGSGWSQLVAEGNSIVVSFDLTLLLFGALFFWAAARKRQAGVAMSRTMGRAGAE